MNNEVDREKALEWLDEACENQDDAHDFVCRLRNAMHGLDYKEGCPALDYFVMQMSNVEELVDMLREVDDELTETKAKLIELS